MIIEVDIDEIKEFVTGGKFTHMLMEATDSVGTTAFIVQACLNEIERAESEDNEDELDII